MMDSLSKTERAVPAAARFDHIAEFLQREYLDTGRLAGAQLAIQHRGALYECCMGFLDRERTRALGADTIYRIFSMTKPVTSVAVMMLVEEGRLGLDDPITRYIPAWSDLKVRERPIAQDIRIVDLLAHTSGLTYGIQYRTEIDALYRKTLSMQPGGQALDEFAASLSKLPLEFEPGTAWNYSVATDVLGYVIELVSGLSLRDFFKRRIFDPLDMHDTDFSVSPTHRSRLAECYVRRPGELLGLPSPAFEGDLTAEPTFFSGGGGLLSTVHDYLRFCNVILGRGEFGAVRMLKPESLALMTTNHLPNGGDLPTVAQGVFANSGYAGIGFGLGFATTIDPSIAVLRGNRGDAFWSGMANTFFWCDPTEQLIGIFMTQILPSETYPLQQQIRAHVYDAIRGIPA
jgi:CubicO group peptidase (beta-lactamase class C family)